MILASTKKTVLNGLFHPYDDWSTTNVVDKMSGNELSVF
jgi:hypothetical protein